MPQVRVRRASYAPLPDAGRASNAAQASSGAAASATARRLRSATVAVPLAADGGPSRNDDLELETRKRSSTTTGTMGSIGRFLGRSSGPEQSTVQEDQGLALDNSHPLETTISGAPSAPLDLAPPLEQDQVSPLPPRPIRQNSATLSVALPKGGRARSNSRTLQSIFADEPVRKGRSNSITGSARSSSPVAGAGGRRTSEVGLSDADVADRNVQEQKMLERLESGIPEMDEDEHHEEEVADHLDVIDAQIATVSHLQNCTNSIMIPHLPALWSRKPIVTLPDTPSDDSLVNAVPIADNQPLRSSSASSTSQRRRSRSQSVASRTKPLTADDALDRHVEHVLRKRDKAKRALRGLWDFLKTPMGITTGIYGFLVVFWGAAIVLFLLNWIDAGSDYSQKLWIEISSQVVNGLFTITGVGLIPWRAMDTYRIVAIWRLKRRTIKLRKERGLLPLVDPNDLPDPETSPETEIVLTEKQQARLKYQQEKFMASQTWYRPHETSTHRAFKISWGVWICVLTDGNSFFQCILCGTMWGLNRFDRPAWTTGCLIPLSFLCGIGGAAIIWMGGNKTKKRIEVEKKLREALGMQLASAGFQLDKDAVRRAEVPGTHQVGDKPSARSDAGTGHEKDAEVSRKK